MTEPDRWKLDCNNQLAFHGVVLDVSAQLIRGSDCVDSACEDYCQKHGCVSSQSYWLLILCWIRSGLFA